MSCGFFVLTHNKHDVNAVTTRDDMHSIQNVTSCLRSVPLLPQDDSVLLMRLGLSPLALGSVRTKQGFTKI